ncbi:hypothetical protein LDENG_00216570, partial [Lucifuga dentata]
MSVHFVMPWFLTLFTSLPCWDSVLAVWDLITLHGLSAVFRTALTIIQLLETRLLDLSDEGAVLPLLLRVPVDVAQYTVLVPALWNTEVQDWEIKCMNSLVLDETHHGPKAEHFETTLTSQVKEEKEKENEPDPSERDMATGNDSVTGAKSVFFRVFCLAQRYFLGPMGLQKVEEKSSQARPRHDSPAARQVFKNQTSASLTQAQIRSRRRSQRRHGSHQPAIQETSSDVTVTFGTVTDTTASVKTE